MRSHDSHCFEGQASRRYNRVQLSPVVESDLQMRLPGNEVDYSEDDLDHDMLSVIQAMEQELDAVAVTVSQ